MTFQGNRQQKGNAWIALFAIVACVCGVTAAIIKQPVVLLGILLYAVIYHFCLSD